MQNLIKLMGSNTNNIPEHKMIKSAKRRAISRIFNNLNNVIVNMTPEQGSNNDQMKDIYNGQKP